MPFVGSDEVAVRQVDETEWMLLERLIYDGNTERFTVPVDSRTDFASVPRIFVWLLPRYGRYTKAAVLHDHLWRVKATNGEIDWIDADAIFRRAMRELGVEFLRRWIMWAAVRWAALTKPGGRTGWWREGWRVIALTLIALPIVAPPAVVIALALALFTIVETVTWVPIRLAKASRDARHRQTGKEVVPPQMSWRT